MEEHRVGRVPWRRIVTELARDPEPLYSVHARVKNLDALARLHPVIARETIAFGCSGIISAPRDDALASEDVEMCERLVDHVLRPDFDVSLLTDGETKEMVRWFGLDPSGFADVAHRVSDREDRLAQSLPWNACRVPTLDQMLVHMRRGRLTGVRLERIALVEYVEGVRARDRAASVVCLLLLQERKTRLSAAQAQRRYSLRRADLTRFFDATDGTVEAVQAVEAIARQRPTVLQFQAMEACLDRHASMEGLKKHREKSDAVRRKSAQTRRERDVRRLSVQDAESVLLDELARTTALICEGSLTAERILADAHEDAIRRLYDEQGGEIQRAKDAYIKTGNVRAWGAIRGAFVARARTISLRTDQMQRAGKLYWTKSSSAASTSTASSVTAATATATATPTSPDEAPKRAFPVGHRSIPHFNKEMIDRQIVFRRITSDVDMGLVDARNVENVKIEAGPSSQGKKRPFESVTVA